MNYTFSKCHGHGALKVYLLHLINCFSGTWNSLEKMHEQSKVGIVFTNLYFILWKEQFGDPWVIIATRLGYFLKVSVTNFVAKVPKKIVNLEASLTISSLY